MEIIFFEYNTQVRCSIPKILSFFPRDPRKSTQSQEIDALDEILFRHTTKQDPSSIIHHLRTTIPLLSNVSRGTAGLLLILLGRQPQHINLTRQPAAVRLGVEHAVGGEPVGEGCLKLLILQDFARGRLVYHVEFIWDGVLLHRRGDGNLVAPGILAF